jgi:hypothetical protein
VGVQPAPDAPTNVHHLEWFESISIPSAMARLTETGGQMALLVGLVAAICLGLGWWMYRRAGWPLLWPSREQMRSAPGEIVTAIEWFGVIVVALALGPQAHKRHLFLILPLHLLIAALVIRPPRGVSRWPLIAGALAFQAGMYLPPNSDATEPLINQLKRIGFVSYTLLAMYFCAVWTCLSAARARAAVTPGLPAPSSLPRTPDN